MDKLDFVRSDFQIFERESVIAEAAKLQTKIRLYVVISWCTSEYHRSVVHLLQITRRLSNDI